MTRFHTNNFNPIYNLLEISRASLQPYRANLELMQKFLSQNDQSDSFIFNYTKAYLELSERLTRKYNKLGFEINETEVDGEKFEIEIKTVAKKPFCNLLHFSKKGIKKKLPKFLAVAPMAGHYATLLTKTVKALLPHFDVYITDWIDAAQVPLSEGGFDFDDYIDYVIQFIEMFDEPVHVLAVCQPTVPVLAAVSIMSNEKSKKLPASMIMIGGPIDARENPTDLNDFVTDHKLSWFEENVITTVPSNYPGAGRKVYPGFLQLSAFISLKVQDHVKSCSDFFFNVANQNEKEAEIHRKFYDEYLAVMDLPAEFYLQTIQEVFKKFSLAKGKLKSRGREADVENITSVALLGIEGEKDDISAVGQTLAVIDLCENIPKSKKQYHLQPEVGHYGVFSGSKFTKFIVPVIKDFCYKHQPSDIVVVPKAKLEVLVAPNHKIKAEQQVAPPKLQLNLASKPVVKVDQNPKSAQSKKNNKKKK